jgi:4-amino-4-deoxy-L-arabinose transferase-like glycosyltransferase
MPRISPAVWALAALTLVVHALTNGGYNVFRDEFYYIACGKHLAWGYVDHPPAIAFIARITTALFGESAAGLRFFPAMAGAATVFLAGVMARDLGARGFGQALASLCVVVAPVYLEGFTLLTMNAFDFLCWTVLCWLLIRMLQGGDLRNWVTFGIVAGLGLLNKTSVLFLLAGVGLGLLVTKERRQLASRWPWIGGVIAAVLFAPYIAWEIQHGWPTLEFISRAQAEKNAVVSPWDFFTGQVLIHHPLTAPVWLAGLTGLLFAPRLSAARALGVAYLAIFALFIATHAKLYYLSPMYPVLFAAGGEVLEHVTAARALQWLRPAIATLLVAGGALLAPATLPILSPERLEGYLQALHLKAPLMERHRAPRLTQTFADEFGWEEMVAKVAAVYRGLTPEEQASVAIFTSNYGEAGAIDFYGPQFGLPSATSGHNNYWLWGPPPGRGRLVITVGESEEDVAKTYDDVRTVDHTNNDWAMPYENNVPIIVGRHPKATLEQVWERCKKFI